MWGSVTASIPRCSQTTWPNGAPPQGPIWVGGIWGRHSQRRGGSQASNRLLLQRLAARQECLPAEFRGPRRRGCRACGLFQRGAGYAGLPVSRFGEPAECGPRKPFVPGRSGWRVKRQRLHMAALRRICDERQGGTVKTVSNGWVKLRGTNGGVRGAGAGAMPCGTGDGGRGVDAGVQCHAARATAVAGSMRLYKAMRHERRRSRGRCGCDAMQYERRGSRDRCGAMRYERRRSRGRCGCTKLCGTSGGVRGAGTLRAAQWNEQRKTRAAMPARPRFLRV